MKSHQINYHQFHGQQFESNANFNASPFSLDGVGFDLESESQVTSKDKVYSMCPAWKHRSNRIFNVYSPVDLELKIDVENRRLNTPNLNQDKFDEFFSETFEHDWCTDENVTIQSSIPRFLFWTKSKNIWIEQRPHPLTSRNNNFVCVGGWFNISNWTRPISFGFDLVNPDEPVIIRRGDPLYQISFHSTNLDDGFRVKKSEPPRDILNKVHKTKNVLFFFNNKLPLNIKNNLFKNKESKCPFHFLWK